MDYRDDLITVDDTNITIARHGATRRPHTIPLHTIRRASPFPLRFGTGKYRLVGISPLKPRTSFHWDRRRRHKTTAIELDVGRWLRIGLTPDDPNAVLDLIRRHLNKGG